MQLGYDQYIKKAVDINVALSDKAVAGERVR